MPRPKKKVVEDSEIIAEKKSTSHRGRPKKTASSSSSSLNLGKFFSGIRSNVTENRKKYSRYVIALVVIIAIGFLAFLNKQWFVVAVINRQPITTIEYYQNLKAKDGQTILDQLIRDKLITQEAERENVKVTQADIDTKYKEVEKQVGGADQLKSALQQGNLSNSDFREQLKIELFVEKMLGDKVAVSDKEIDAYITANPTDPNVTGTTSGKPDRAAIKDQLKSNKLNDNFTTWYDALQKKSSILKFI